MDYLLPPIPVLYTLTRILEGVHNSILEELTDWIDYSAN